MPDGAAVPESMEAGPLAVGEAAGSGDEGLGAGDGDGDNAAGSGDEATNSVEEDARAATAALAAIRLSVDGDCSAEGVQPEFLQEVWQVVGGGQSDGILVREDCELSSPFAVRSEDGLPDRIASRLASGSCVKKLADKGSRFQYELLVGTGPATGWVSASIPDKACGTKELLVKVPEPPGPGPCSMPATLLRGIQMPFAPRIIWTYWDQGVKALPAFHKLCIESWRKRCPTWRVEVVDRETIFDFVSAEDLPATFDEMLRRQHRSDCARSALLYRHGGIYMDPTILAWRDVSQVVQYSDIERGVKDYAGFFRSSYHFVENWFMACRKGCEFIEKWHKQHLLYWENRKSVDRRFRHDTFFRGVDFKWFSEDELEYLAQHACLTKLIGKDKNFEQMVKNRTLVRDSTAPTFGGLWTNRRLLHRATAQADMRRLQRQIQRKETGVYESKGSLIKHIHALKQHDGKRAGVMDKVERLAYIGDIEDAVAAELLGEEDKQHLVAEIVSRKVPFAKFTGPVNEQLRRLRLRDILLWPSTLRRLLVLALGPEFELPSPPGGRPPVPRARLARDAEQDEDVAAAAGARKGGQPEEPGVSVPREAAQAKEAVAGAAAP